MTELDRLAWNIESVLRTAVYYPDDSGGYYVVSPLALERLAESAGYPLSRVTTNYGSKE